jgi:hypothetical protein
VGIAGAGNTGNLEGGLVVRLARSLIQGLDVLDDLLESETVTRQSGGFTVSFE